MELDSSTPQRALDVSNRFAPHLKPHVQASVAQGVPFNFYLRDQFNIDFVYGDNDEMVREFVLVNRARIKRLCLLPLSTENIERLFSRLTGEQSVGKRTRLFSRLLRIQREYGESASLESLSGASSVTFASTTGDRCGFVGFFGWSESARAFRVT